MDSGRLTLRTGPANPQWLLGDHLGCTNVTANYNGSLHSKNLYHPWGTVRYASGTLPTRYTFIGQYSYATNSASGFGLLYVARWYDLTLGRFIQADSVVPSGVQGLDRYAAMNNNPVRYTDPSGHASLDPQGCHTPDCKPPKPDPMPSGLTEAGQAGYDTYITLWNTSGWWWSDPLLGGDGVFSLEDFLLLILYIELDAMYQNAEYVGNWKEALTRSYYTWQHEMERLHPGAYATDPSTAGLLNFIMAYTGPNTRTNPHQFNNKHPTSDALPVVQGVLDAMKNPAGAGHPEWEDGCVSGRPCRAGSHAPYTPDLPYINTFINSNCEPSFDVYGSCAWNSNFSFFLDADDADYWSTIQDDLTVDEGD